MRRSLPWALCASAIVFAACASNEQLDFVPTSETPPQTIPDDAGSTPAADSGSTNDGGAPVVSGDCGDGKVTAGEECDDGNNVSGDGCSNACKIESAGPNDVCPGVAIALTGTGADPRKGSINGSTGTTYGQYAGACGGGTGREAVYVVTPDVTGLLTAKVTSQFDSVLYARRTCAEQKTEAACNDAPGASGGEQIKVPVQANTPIYLFVDGYSGSAGSFTLDVDVATAFCGNGVAEAPEACDDGNTVAGDGCSPTCTLEAGGVLGDCPGQGVALTGTGNNPRTISFAGNTSTLGSSSTLSASGCTASGVNAVYAITPDIDGSMTAKLVAAYDNATLHIQGECDTASAHTQLDCKEATEPYQTLEVTVPVRAGFPHFVVVDSSSTTYSGTYTLDVTVNPAQCGNKIVDGNEECDDGNTTVGDGCAANCKLEPINPATDTCPGTVLPLVAGPSGTYAGVVTSSTSKFAADYKPKSTSCSSITVGRDAVYQVTSPIDGLMTAKAKGTFDTQLYARDGCGTDTTLFNDLACTAAVDGNGAETITFPVNANTPVWIVVDGDATEAHGVFELAVGVTPSVCGNSVVEGGETCDDGNSKSGDGCDASCKLEPATSHDTCANAEAITLTANAGGTYSATIASGTTNLAHNQTFTGCTSSGPDAIYTVTSPIDGVLTAEVPVATFNVSLGARSTCPPSTTSSVPIVCSNASSDDGLEEISFSVEKDKTYYLIVDSTAATQLGTFTMLVNIRPPGCGDGLISGTEACDDGNTTNGDGCSSTCTVETLTGVDTCPGYTLPLKGTGSEPRTGVLTMSTANLNANYAASCGGSSKDGVVVVTPDITGKLTAKLTGLDYHAVLYLRTQCANAASEPTTATSTTALACDDDAPNPSTNARETTTKVTAGTPVYIFVDGYNGQSGVARLNVTVTP